MKVNDFIKEVETAFHIRFSFSRTTAAEYLTATILTEHEVVKTAPKQIYPLKNLEIVLFAPINHNSDIDIRPYLCQSRFARCQ